MMKTPISSRFGISIILILVVSILTACEAENSNESTASSSRTVVALENNNINDESILAALYLDNRVPADFYVEDFTNDAFTSVSHVKNTIFNNEPNIVYELSTDDFSEAIEFTEKSASTMPVYKEMVDNDETDLYFQFTRVDPENPEFVHFSRIFKKSALDRSNVDRTAQDGYRGKITFPAFTAQRVKQVIEYLWMFSYSNNYGNAVLQSTTFESDTEFKHTMIEAKLISTHPDDCDVVEIYENLYTISKDTGSIWKDRILVREFSGQRDSYFEFHVCQSN